MLQQISSNFTDDILQSFALTFSFNFDISTQRYKYWMNSIFSMYEIYSRLFFLWISLDTFDFN